MASVHAPAASPRARHFGAVARLSTPIYVAQIAVFANAVADTIIAGHYKVEHLAAVGIGASIWACVFLPLMGILQGLSPIIGRHYGAGEFAAIGRNVRASVWLALALSIPIMAVFALPEHILELAQVPPNVRPITHAYLRALAFGVPGIMLARAFYAFAPAVGQPRAVMTMNLGAMAIKIPLSWALVHGAWGLPEMGGTGCGVASTVSYWLMAGAAGCMLWFGPAYRRFHIRGGSWGLDPATLKGALRLGGPIGVSILIEVTAFTSMALFLARLGATVSAAQQIAANLAALLFMLPLSMGIGTQVLVSQALGRRDPAEARAVAQDGLGLAGLCATVVCIGVWLARGPIVAFYTADPGVARIAFALFPILLVFHWFDAQQCVLTQALRGYHEIFVPTVIYAVALWGIGLGAGYVLAFAPAGWGVASPLGATGFWWAQTASLAVAGAALYVEFLRVSRPAHRRTVSESVPGRD